MIAQGLGSHREHFGADEGCDLTHIVLGFSLTAWGKWSLLGTMVRTFANLPLYLTSLNR